MLTDFVFVLFVCLSVCSNCLFFLLFVCVALSVVCVLLVSMFACLVLWLFDALSYCLALSFSCFVCVCVLIASWFACLVVWLFGSL